MEETFPGIGAEADLKGLPVVDEGDGEIAELGGIEIGAEAFLSGGHEGAVEGGADGEDDGLPGTGGFGEIGGALHGGGVSGDDDLVGGVEIGGADDFALGGFGEDGIEFALGEFEEGGHGAESGGNGLLHVLAAVADEADGVGKVEGSGGDEGGVFAEAVAGDVIGGKAGFGEDGEGGGGDGEECGLGELGEFELVFGAFEAEAGEGVAESVIGGFEDVARGGVRIEEGLAHAYGLGTLAREEECGFGCQSKL